MSESRNMYELIESRSAQRIGLSPGVGAEVGCDNIRGLSDVVASGHDVCEIESRIREGIA